MELYELIDKLILKSSRVIREEKEKLLKKDELNRLTYGHFNILYWISVQEDATITSLSKVMNMSKPTMTVHIQNLEKIGVVAKEKSTQDKRITYIRLTDMGMDIEKAEFNAFKRLELIATSKLSKDESEQLKVLFEKLLFDEEA